MAEIILDQDDQATKEEAMTLANRPERVAAYIVDAVLVFGAIFLVLMVWRSMPDLGDTILNTTALTVIALPVYRTFCHLALGRSLSKMLFGMHLVQYDGLPLRLRSIFLRSSLGLSYVAMALVVVAFQTVAVLLAYDGEETTFMLTLVMGALYLLLLALDGFWLLFSKNGQALHDVIGGTLVVATTKNRKPWLTLF